MARFLPLVVLLFLLFSTFPVYSATFDIPSGEVTGLIGAINAANANGEENTINLEPGTYTLTEIDNGVPSDSNGLPVITGIITIHGNDAQTTHLERSSTARFRILSIASYGDLTIEGLTVRNGFVGFRTGGFANDGILTIERSIIENMLCCTFGEEGAFSIDNAGILEISDTHVRKGLSRFGTSAIRNLGTMTIVRSSISFNSSDAATVVNLGVATIDD